MKRAAPWIVAGVPSPLSLPSLTFSASLAGGLLGHLLRRQTAEFLVNDREQFGGGFWITVFHPFQNMRELAQAFRIGKRRWVTTSNAPTF